MRQYAEDLAQLWPERFFVTILPEGGPLGEWVLTDRTPPTDAMAVYPTMEACDVWAFWGPLAEELKVKGDSITAQEKQPDGRYLALIEAIAAAVVEKVRERRP